MQAFAWHPALRRSLNESKCSACSPVYLFFKIYWIQKFTELSNIKE